LLTACAQAFVQCALLRTLHLVPSMAVSTWFVNDVAASVTARTRGNLLKQHPAVTAAVNSLSRTVARLTAARRGVRRGSCAMAGGTGGRGGQADRFLAASQHALERYGKFHFEIGATRWPGSAAVKEAVEDAPAKTTEEIAEIVRVRLSARITQ
jgi:hypothetical protein